MVEFSDLTDSATLVEKATITEVGSEQMQKEREKGGMKRKSMSMGGVSANVFTNSGATKLFISRDFVHKLKLKAKPLKESLQVEKANHEDIPTVNEFEDVFPQDLLGLPPDREIEFAIKLDPETVPVSKAPYWLAPLKMKDLATQLQELLEKGHVINKEGVFVNPTKIEAISNWGRPTTPTEKELNMRHRRWLELIKDYDYEILYHPEKTNMVVDALSKKEKLKMIMSSEELIREFEKIEIEVKVTENGTEKLFEIAMQPELLEKIRFCQERMTSEGRESMIGGKINTEKDDKGIMKYSYRIWVSNIQELKDEILDESYSSRFEKKGKLSPRYIRPFDILRRIEKLAYELALPPNLQQVHNVFHVSMLRKYNPDARHIMEYEHVDMKPDLTYV
ncbi:hypothetical protein AgCh_005045 [Apium graveolens]